MSVLAVLEQNGGVWGRTSFETLAAAQQFASQMGCAAEAAVLGSGVGRRFGRVGQRGG